MPIKVYAGADAICQVVREKDIDIVLTAMVGFSGLRPTIAAIEAHKTIALANKETLVVAGELIKDLALRHHAPIITVDSEHSAIFQSIMGEQSPIEKLILTASGGPFRTFTREQLATVTREQALKHPNWDMGAKITIDSASMMNKGFEVIEAVKAQLGVPDMRVPIQLAFSYPERLKSSFDRLDFVQASPLTFEAPDTERFRNLALAYVALDRGGNMPCILNAANEIVNRAFLENRIGFLQMSTIIEEIMQQVSFLATPTLEDYFETDAEARRYAAEKIN